MSRRTTSRPVTLVSLALTVAAALLTACGGLPDPKFVEEKPVGSDSWTELSAEPAWVTAPPPREGHMRFVVTSRSNMRRLAIARNMNFVAKKGAEAVSAKLAGVLGEADLDAAAAAVTPDGLSPVFRISKDEILTKKMVPGNTMSTVSTLWEVPVSTITDALPEGTRAAAVAALTTQ